MPSPQHGAATNALIGALPRRDRRRILAGCERVDLACGEVMCEAGGRIRHVYFPVAGFVSLQTPRDHRTSLEVGLVGSEGMLGVPLLLGIGVSPWRAVVQASGGALRIDAARFRLEVAHGDALREASNRYLYVAIAQLSLAVACMQFHLLEARLARSLLMAHDRAHMDDFHLTHELLAQMLGVRRVGVTAAAGALQRRELIRYRRGNVTILARGGLEAASCSCYRAGRDVYDRILGTHRS